MQFIRQISSFQHIALFGHKHPDGDAIGSMLGLGRVLEKLHKKVSYITPTPPSPTFNFLTGWENIHTDFDYGQYDCLLFVDFNALSRLGAIYNNNPDYFTTLPIMTIDHHEGYPDFTLSSIQDNTATSCCELIFEVIQHHRSNMIDEQVATCLLCGHITDSGNFMYDKDSKRALGNATGLLSYGADKAIIIQTLFYHKPLGALQIIQRVLSRMQQQGKMLWSWVNDKDIQEFNIETEDAKQALMMMTKVDGFDIYVLIHQEGEAEYKLHLRSVGEEYDVADLAKKLGGGGHYNASGATVKATSVAEVVEKVKRMM